MLNKISINVLLKSVIATLAVAVVIALSLSAWSSWTRLAAVNRIAAVADTSGYLFTALHNLRVDRASTYRDLLSERQTTELAPLLKATRDADMSALKSALIALQAAEFPGKESAISNLSQAITKLTSLHQESTTAFAMPLATRRQGLAQEYNNMTAALMESLDNISSQLTRSVKLEDSFVDQLMELKQLAWVARNAGGDASVLISNGLSGLPVPPDAMLRYTTNLSKLETAWSALEDIASGLPLPPSFGAAVDKAKREFFGPDYVELRMKTLKALIAGEKVNIKVNDWTPMAVAKLASLLGVAETSLDVAKEYAASQRASALWRLSVELALQVAAIALAAGMMLLVSRRATGPLQQMAGVLVELTNDHVVDVPYTSRGDEIGDIAKATEVFKQSIAQKVINLRVRSGLDVVRSNVMIADDSYNIMYMNTTLQEMMKEAESELRKVLPNFDAGKLLGANMDVFHKNPAHQRQILESLTGAHETHMTVGSQKFHLVATPVVDQHGKRSGTVVEWRNETIEKAVEGEIGDIVKAAVIGDFSKRVPLEGKKEFMLNLATAMNSLCENTAKALQDLVGMMGSLADGDMTQRITADYQGMFGQLKADANKMAERIGANCCRDQGLGGRSHRRLGGDIDQHDRPVAAHRGTGRQSGRNLGFDGRDRGDRQEERRERAGGQSVGERHPRSRRPRRPGGRQGGRSNGQDRGTPRARSPTSSASSTRSPGRPTCWRSTPRSRPRAPAKPAADLRWWRPKCAAWRSVHRKPRKTSRT